MVRATSISRYTLDDESAEVELVEMDTRERGKLYITFTQSAYWDCRDMDDPGDEQTGTLLLEVDLENGCLRVGGGVRRGRAEHPRRILRDAGRRLRDPWEDGEWEIGRGFALAAANCFVTK